MLQGDCDLGDTKNEVEDEDEASGSEVGQFTPFTNSA